VLYFVGVIRLIQHFAWGTQTQASLPTIATFSKKMKLFHFDFYISALYIPTMKFSNAAAYIN